MTIHADEKTDAPTLPAQAAALVPDRVPTVVDHIHTHGKRHLPGQLVRRITGQPLSPAPLLRHLRHKAADLYGVN